MIPHEFNGRLGTSLLSTVLFSECTAKRLVYNHAMRHCKGPCKQTRSLGQFVNGDTLCIKCRRNAPK